MSSTKESRAVVQGIYDAVMRQDHEAFMAALHDDPGTSALVLDDGDHVVPD